MNGTGGGRADRRADLHRRLGDGVAGRSGARRGFRPARGQRFPRRRSHLRRPGVGGHGGRSVRGVRHEQAHRHRRCPDSQRQRPVPHDRRHPRLARRPRRRLARHLRRDQGQLRLRQVRRQLPHGAEPRPHHPRPAARQRRLPTGADDRQHLRLGHGLQLRQSRLSAGHSARPRRHRRRVPIGAARSPTSAICRARTAAAASATRSPRRPD